MNLVNQLVATAMAILGYFALDSVDPYQEEIA